MSDTQNLINIPDYARDKGVTRQRIYNLITAGVIIPVTIGKKDFIDLDAYKDFDPSKRVEKEVSISSLKETVSELIKENKSLRDRLVKVEKVVYGNSDFAASKK